MSFVSSKICFLVTDLSRTYHLAVRAKFWVKFESRTRRIDSSVEGALEMSYFGGDQVYSGV